MKTLPFFLLAAAALVSCTGKQSQAPETEMGVRDLFPNYTIGVAINVDQSNGVDVKGDSIITRHFNSIVPENCMKCEKIHPLENEYFWDDADNFVKFGEDHNMQVIGHCLIWHSQCAPWFWYDSEGKLVSAEVLKERMREHITTVVSRYKGRIKGWDVVNEAIEDDGNYRNSPFYQILGEEFIPLAFQYAHEADPDCELYYNDYSMAKPGKRAGVVRLVQQLKERGLRIDAVGMQSHMGLDHPDWAEFEASIQAFIGAGVNVQFTEVDMGALPTVTQHAEVSDNFEYQAALNPYPEALPDSIAQLWNERMDYFMNLVDKYADHVNRITAWGVTDADSWKNDWPIVGRTDYPLWFDRNYQLKPFLQNRLDAAK